MAHQTSESATEEESSEIREAEQLAHILPLYELTDRNDTEAKNGESRRLPLLLYMMCISRPNNTSTLLIRAYQPKLGTIYRHGAPSSAFGGGEAGLNLKGISGVNS